LQITAKSGDITVIGLISDLAKPNDKKKFSFTEYPKVNLQQGLQ